MRYSINLLLLTIIAICALKVKSQTITLFEDQIWADGEYKACETILFDVDKDGIKDSIVLYHITDWSDPGDFHKIAIKITTDKTYEIYNIGDWIKTESEHLKKIPNRVQSEYILIAEVAPNKDILIIEGYAYASSPGSLTVLSLFDNNIKPLFKNEFDLQCIEDSDKDGVKELIGWNYYSQFIGYPNLDSLSIAGSYCPYYVLKLLPDTIVLDTTASEDYNYKNYVGYFGLDFDVENRYGIVEPNSFVENTPYFEPYFYFEKYREYPETSLRFLTAKEMESLTKEELQIIRNEIFAFHGYSFKSEELRKYFSKFTWYKPIEGVTIDERLNKYEKANIKLIKHLESSM